MPLNTSFIVADGWCHCKTVDIMGWGNVFRTYGEGAQRVFTAAFRAQGRAAHRLRIYIGDVHYLRRITLSRPNTRVRSSSGKVWRGSTQGNAWSRRIIYLVPFCETTLIIFSCSTEGYSVSLQFRKLDLRSLYQTLHLNSYARAPFGTYSLIRRVRSIPGYDEILNYVLPTETYYRQNKRLIICCKRYKPSRVRVKPPLPSWWVCGMRKSESYYRRCYASNYKSDHNTGSNANLLDK